MTSRLHRAFGRRSRTTGLRLVVLEFYAMADLGTDIKTVLDTLDFAEAERAKLVEGAKAVADDRDRLAAENAGLAAQIADLTAKLAGAIIPDANDAPQLAALHDKAEQLRAAGGAAIPLNPSSGQPLPGLVGGPNVAAE